MENSAKWKSSLKAIFQMANIEGIDILCKLNRFLIGYSWEPIKQGEK